MIQHLLSAEQRIKLVKLILPMVDILNQQKGNYEAMICFYEAYGYPELAVQQKERLIKINKDLESYDLQIKELIG